MNKITGVFDAEGELMLFVDGVKLSPKPSQKLWNKSPDGFHAGYGGSGPAQSALAILLHVLKDKENILKHFQDFKWEFLAKPEYFNKDFIFEVDIKAWIIEREVINSMD